MDRAMRRSPLEHADELASRQTTLRELVDDLPIAQIILNEEGRILLANRMFSEWIGTSIQEETELDEASLEHWFQLIPADLSLQDTLVKVAMTGAREILSALLVSTQQTLELHVHPLHWRNPLSMNPCVDQVAEKPLLWMLIHDVTQQRVTEQQLKRAERLASIGELSANLAHELSRPIDGSLRYLQFLLDDLSEDDPRRRYAIHVQDGLLRMARIVKGLLYFSRQNAQNMDPICIHQALEQVLTFFEDELQKHDIQTTKSFVQELPMLLCKDLEQVFLNLVKNAIQAMPDGGILKLATYIESQSAGAEQIVCVEVTDTGHGMPWDIQSRVFTPFFTTKDIGEGTGLGLSISRGIVERYHGEIKIESRLHQGTTVMVRIPVESAE